MVAHRQFFLLHILLYTFLVISCTETDPIIVIDDSADTIKVEANAIFTELDTKSIFGSNTVNAASFSDGSVVILQDGGDVFRVYHDGSSRLVLSVQGSQDWRGVWMDSEENLFVSPHSSSFKMDESYNGIYKMGKNDNVFHRVLSLYDTSSSVASEREDNDDTMWTFCEDNDHNLYAGVYAHTVRANPSIYKSIDHGEHWSKIFDFNEKGLTTGGMHIHSIIFNEYDNALYCIVGEANNIFRSRDSGMNWESLGIKLEGDKGASMIAVSNGLIVGSDGAYACTMSKIYLNSSRPVAVTTFKMWANTVFAIRRSHVTGYLYAFTKIDSSVSLDYYFPPADAENNYDVISQWISAGNNKADDWGKYYYETNPLYPDDAIHPHHCAVLVSKDNGKSWEKAYIRKTDGIGPAGFWTISYFCGSQCLAGFFDANITSSNPIVLTETVPGITLERPFSILDSITSRKTGK